MTKYLGFDFTYKKIQACFQIAFAIPNKDVEARTRETIGGVCFDVPARTPAIVSGRWWGWGWQGPRPIVRTPLLGIENHLGSGQRFAIDAVHKKK